MRNAAAYAASYRTAEVETLSQRDLLVKLYQGSEKFIQRGRMAMINKQYELSNDSLQKAKRIFMELLSTLNFEVGGEVAQNLRDLYLFLISEIVEANLRQEPKRLEALMPVITTLREAWEEIPDSEANTTSLRVQGGGQSFDARS